MQTSPTPMQLLTQAQRDQVALSAKFESALSTIELVFEQVAAAGNQQALWIMLTDLQDVHEEGSSLLTD